MVSTRHHPREFPPAVLGASPTKSPAKSSRTSTSSPTPSSPATPSKSLTKRALTNSIAASPSSPPAAVWAHTASNVTVAWILVSLPVVVWDALYCLLRPHTMAGGALQWPLWKPYELYASIDYVYGWPAWEARDGFTAAQAWLNMVEVIGYGLYITILYDHGASAAGGRGLQFGHGVEGWFAGGRRVQGRQASRAVVIAFVASVMTASKTVLYFLNEACSGFKNVRHNEWVVLVPLYIATNGIWLVMSSYMTYVFGAEIIEGLDAASGVNSKKDQ
ncbi:uncharacterized protein BDZ99DRAFT_484469 [Mytilinidion resinicola]|uniref:Emopamil-binding protein n=1 Tax=Mytilinidion resinicola TaxID=574789 RepID=A0A6A6ZBT7_9PEZI|nr:uncharacterized protein BDZ99DRAFT_484469 [Mytilinidion resinicola]KAF2817687.1 hypothetical protein BDZ99DRAFT_484469 [Mytilinidion resinicola]